MTKWQISASEANSGDTTSHLTDTLFSLPSLLRKGRKEIILQSFHVSKDVLFPAQNALPPYTLHSAQVLGHKLLFWEVQEKSGGYMWLNKVQGEQNCPQDPQKFPTPVLRHRASKGRLTLLIV